MPALLQPCKRGGSPGHMPARARPGWRGFPWGSGRKARLRVPLVLGSSWLIPAVAAGQSCQRRSCHWAGPEDMHLHLRFQALLALVQFSYSGNSELRSRSACWPGLPCPPSLPLPC